MHGGADHAVERGVEIAPFAARSLRRDGQAHGLEHRGDADRIGREQLADQRHHRHVVDQVSRTGDGACSASSRA